MPHRRASIPKAFILGAFILCACFLLNILPAHADSSAKSHPAESYIADFFRATVETAVAPQSDAYATKAVKTLLIREISLNETARFMFGRAWPTDNKQAAAGFQEEFQDFVAEAVTRGLRQNPTTALVVQGSRARTDGSILVLSTLSLPSGKALPVDWQVEPRPADGTFQITHIAVAGMDGAILLRSVAATVLAEGATDAEGLIPWLRAALSRHAEDGTATPASATPSSGSPPVTSP